MKRITFFLIFAVSIILLSPQGFAWGITEGESANVGYIKLGDIKGESQDQKYKEWIEVLSIDHQKAGPNRRLEIMRLTVRNDRSAPALAAGFRDKKVFASAIIDQPMEGKSYLRYELKNVMITSYRTSGDTVLDDVVVVKFEEIKVTYTEFDSAGKRKDTIRHEWTRGPKIL